MNSYIWQPGVTAPNIGETNSSFSLVVTVFRVFPQNWPPMQWQCLNSTSTEGVAWNSASNDINLAVIFLLRSTSGLAMCYLGVKLSPLRKHFVHARTFLFTWSAEKPQILCCLRKKKKVPSKIDKFAREAKSLCLTNQYTHHWSCSPYWCCRLGWYSWQ